MKPNIHLFFIDTLRPDQLALAAAAAPTGNFLGKVLRSGVCFEDFHPAGGTTRISVNAFCNGFYGGTSGLNHQHCQDRFATSEVLNLGDICRHAGYRTIALTQASAAARMSTACVSQSSALLASMPDCTAQAVLGEVQSMAGMLVRRAV